MAVFGHFRLVSLAVLMLASQFDFTSATVRVFNLHARDLTGDPAGNKPDPYVKIWCGSSFGGQTEFLKNTANPFWSAEFTFPNCKANDNLRLEVWDKDLKFDDRLGICTRQVQYGSFTAMAVFDRLGLLSLTVLMLASQLDFTGAAVRVSSIYARGLTGDPFGNQPDPYLKVWCGTTFGGQTGHQNDNANPSWFTEFNFPNCNANNKLKIEVWDKDLIFDDHLGTCIKTLSKGVFNQVCYLNAGTLYYTYTVHICVYSIFIVTEHVFLPTAMAVFDHFRLVSLVVLMLASQLDFASAYVFIHDMHAINLSGDSGGNKPDPYLKIWCGSDSMETGHFQGNANPIWPDTVLKCTSGEKLQVEVWDKDVKYDDLLSSFSLTVGTGSNNVVTFSVGKGKMNFSYGVK
ncbi:Perforin-1 [Labeo rohita]|uniref:Perforin-1 n=1 Tax=Labeo rohita TaxID=84645 RepID=A0ABQ8MRR4_LABRO|nr:Perforin-1 [Labeo rohita]